MPTAAKKTKYLVRYPFSVTIMRGRDNLNTFSSGETAELTEKEYERVKHQVEPYTEEAAAICQAVRDGDLDKVSQLKSKSKKSPPPENPPKK